jgi:hypothetical protein
VRRWPQEEDVEIFSTFSKNDDYICKNVVETFLKKCWI